MRCIALLLLVACVDTGPGPQPKRIDPAYINANLLAQIPPDLSPRLDVSLGPGIVTYLGNKVSHEGITPGGQVNVTHYWRVDKPPGPGWRVFTRVRGAPNTADFMNLPATDMELGHPPEAWRAGQIIADIQDVTLRPDWRSQTAVFEVGLIRVGEHGIGDRMAASGANTHDNAVIARALQVDLSRAPAPPGTIYIPRATGPITVDGFANEPAWTTAIASPELVTAEGSPEPLGKATAKMTWDDDNLYVFVTVTDTDIVSEYKKHDDPLWKADDVEIFIDADSNRRGYVELQVNPNNATFDSWFATTRNNGPNAGGDPAWDSGMVTVVKLHGSSEPNDTDQGWEAEIAIPWAAVKGRDDNMKVRLPPQVGDKWRLNVVRVDSQTASKSQGVSSWNRITYSDFHALDRMLTAVYADKTGSIVPTPSTGQTIESGSATTPNAGLGSGTGSGSAANAGRPGVGSGDAASKGAGVGSEVGSAASVGRPGVGSGAGSAANAGRPGASGAGDAASKGAGIGSGAVNPNAGRPGAGSGSAATPRPGAGSGAGSATPPVPHVERTIAPSPGNGSATH